MYFKTGEKVIYDKHIWTIKWVGIDKFYVIVKGKKEIRVDGKLLKRKK